MANVSNGLTEKMKAFCREYVANGGIGTQAYLTAYNSNSESAASIESSKLLQREDIQEYINTLNKPIVEAVQRQVISERDRKRAVLWEIIASGDNNDKCRALDILNKMDMEYVNINRNIEEKTDLNNLDIDTLKKLSDGL